MPVGFTSDEVNKLRGAEIIIDDLMGQYEEGSREWNALNEIWCLIIRLINE